MGSISSIGSSGKISPGQSSKPPTIDPKEEASALNFLSQFIENLAALAKEIQLKG